MKLTESAQTGLKHIGIILFFLLIVYVAYHVYEGIQAKKTIQDSKYLNGAFYMNYPPDPYPNFPGSNI